MPLALLAHLVPVLGCVLDEVLGYATEHNVPFGEYFLSVGGQSLWINSDAAPRGELDRILSRVKSRCSDKGAARGQEHGVEVLLEKLIHGGLGAVELEFHSNLEDFIDIALQRLLGQAISVIVLWAKETLTRP